MARQGKPKKEQKKEAVKQQAAKSSPAVFNNILIVLFGIFVILITTFKISGDDDIFWHLETGKFVTENKSVPSTDVFSFASNGQEWVPFEWGWDVLSYTVYSVSGYAGISVLRTLIFLGIFYLFVMLTGKLNISVWIPIIICILLVFGIFDRLIPKPQIISYFFFAVLLYILISSQTFNRGSIKKLYILPLIFLIWCNMHMGVLAGAGILTIFVVSEVIIYLKSYGNIKPLDKKSLMTLVVIYVLSLLALLVNPHGFYTYQYVYSHLNMKMLEDVYEWYSPFNKVFSGSIFQYIYFGFLLGTAVVLYYAYKTKNIFFGLTILVFAVFSLSSVRYSIDFMVISSILFAVSLGMLLGEKANIKIPALITGAALVLLFVVIPSDNLYSYLKYPRVFGFGVDERYYPARVINFVKDNNIQNIGTRPFNSFNSGGYLIWQLGGTKNFIDSRNLTDDIYFSYKAINNKQAGFEQKLEQYNFDYIIWFYPFLTDNSVELKTSIVSFLIKNSAKWKLVYWDDSSCLFVKNDEKFRGIINKYEYKFVNPYYYIYDNEPLRQALTNNKQEVINEIQRKYKDEPEGSFINSMVKSFKVPVTK